LKLSVFRLLVWLALGAGACATAPAVGRGGPVYEISIAAVDGQPTAARGPAAFPAITIQVGTEVARVWLAYPSHHHDTVSPVIMEGDAEALKDGILVERSWNEAVVYRVTEDDLSTGVAMVYVPSMLHPPTVVELHFDPAAKPATATSQRQHNLSKGRSALQEGVALRHFR
jgi:hypothetical protein